MLFSSPVFFLFFAGYFLIDFLCPRQWRIFLVIAGSTIFYGYWNPAYVWIPYATAVVAYVGARWIEAAGSSAAAKPCR